MKLDTDLMNATERAEAVFSGEIPDRMPMFLMGVHPYSMCYIELIEEREELLDEFTEEDDNVIITPLGDFTLRYFFGSEIEPIGFGLRTGFIPKLLDEEGNIVADLTPDLKSELLDKVRKELKPEDYKKMKYGKYAGRIAFKSVTYGGRIEAHTVLPNGLEYTWYVGPYLTDEKRIRDWFETYGWPDEFSVNPPDRNFFNETVSRFGDRICFIPQIGGSLQLYESVWPMMGQAKFAYFARKKPELLKEIIEHKKNAQLKILDEIAHIKPKAVFGGDDFGQKGRSLISPAMFRKFYSEPYSEIFGKVHEMDAVIFIHSCGNITDLLDLLIEAGLDGWQSLEPDSLIDFRALKKKYGDRLLMVGGLNQNYLTRSDVGPAEVEAHVKEQLKILGLGGRYIPGPAHDYLNIPLENALALRDAVFKWGKYPLSIP